MNIVDMEEFKAVRKALKGSSTDAILIIQIISVIDYMADMVTEQQEEIDRLTSHLRTLEQSLEEQ